jgi:hypothetical protein
LRGAEPEDWSAVLIDEVAVIRTNFDREVDWLGRGASRSNEQGHQCQDDSFHDWFHFPLTLSRFEVLLIQAHCSF